jgi:hypothetical protein
MRSNAWEISPMFLRVESCCFSYSWSDVVQFSNACKYNSKHIPASASLTGIEGHKRLTRCVQTPSKLFHHANVSCRGGTSCDDDEYVSIFRNLVTLISVTGIMFIIM